MALTERSALRRDPNTFVKKASIPALIRWLRATLTAARHPHVGNLSDRHLRDIGISSADIAEHRHRLPSQHTHHPRG